MKHICIGPDGTPTRLSNCNDHPKWMVLRATWVSPAWESLGTWAVFAPHTFYNPERYTATQQEAINYARKRALQ